MSLQSHMIHMIQDIDSSPVGSKKAEGPVRHNFSETNSCHTGHTHLEVGIIAAEYVSRAAIAIVAETHISLNTLIGLHGLFWDSMGCPMC